MLLRSVDLFRTISRTPERSLEINTVEQNNVVCRPDPSNWILVGLYLLMGGISGGLLIASPEMNSGDWPVILIAGVMVAGALGVAFWMFRSSLVADTEGLRSRRLFRSVLVPWDAVTDYYEDLPKISGTRVTIESPTRSIKVGSDWTNLEALQSAVREKAVNARFHEWGCVGMRSGERWSETFDYEGLYQRFEDGMMLALNVVLWGFGLWGTVRYLTSAAEMAELLGWVFVLIPGLLGAAAFIAYGLLFYGRVPYALESRRRRARRERIIASDEGIIFENSKRRIATAWSDVTDYRIDTRGQLVESTARYVVMTRYGDFDFLATITGIRRLGALVEHNATNSFTRGWRRSEGEALPVDVSRWLVTGLLGEPRVYHYRTRTNRAMLWLLCGGFSCTLPLQWTDGSLADRLGVWVTAAFFFIAVPWSCWRYRAAAVVTDERGITQFAVEGRHFVAWEDIRDFPPKKRDTTFVTVRGAEDRVKFAGTIANYEELVAEIERRTGSQPR